MYARLDAPNVGNLVCSLTLFSCIVSYADIFTPSTSSLELERSFQVGIEWQEDWHEEDRNLLEAG
jgi:hypothetical protein